MIIIAILIIIICYVYKEKSNKIHIPKRIWTFWDNPLRIPKTVKMCMMGWRKHHPDYEIVMLTKENYFSYTTIPDYIASNPIFNASPQHFSDLIRIYVLAEHGGVWIDSTVILSGPMENWLFPDEKEFSGFYLGGFTKHTPVIENWFIACKKGSPFVQKWKEEYIQICRFASIQDYVKSREEMGVDIQKIANPIYLCQHVAAQKVLQLDKYPQDKLILQKAEDGPFRYLVETNWDSEKGVNLAIADPSYQFPIMKMRSAERNVMENHL